MLSLRRGFLGVLALTAVFGVIPAQGQVLAGVPAEAGTARLAGVVRDDRGVGVASARITITSNATGEARTATTAADGGFAVTGLAPGAYTVTIAHFGYRRLSRSDVRLAGESSLDFVLEATALAPVMVTATLREQEISDVPFPVAAPTAQMLRSRMVGSLEDLSVSVAGLSVQNLGPGQSQVAMRGASAGQIARDQPGVKEQVSSYLDDVPISLSLFTPDMDLFDVSRVEVLRGPQGTLFGSGSLAGTVRYITNQPELGTRNVFGEMGGSTIGGGSPGGNVKLGANVPLGEMAAARVAAYYNRVGGYMDAVQPVLNASGTMTGTTTKENVNSGDRTGVRAAVRLAPTDALTITPRLTAQRVQMNGWNRIDAFNILGNKYTTSRPQVSLEGRQLFTQIDEPFTDDFLVGDVNVRYQAGAVDLTSITAYAYRDILVVRDAGALTASITGGSIGLPESVYTLDSPLNDATQAKGLTQEFRLSGGADRARWLVGAFYSGSRRDYGQSLLVAGFEDRAAAAGANIPTKGLRAAKDELYYSDLSYDLKQMAAFGEGTLAVTDRFNLTGGLRAYRFTEDREQIFDGIFANDDNGTALVSVPGSTKATGIAPRAIASFKASDVLTVNAQVSRGFRLGGINDPLNVPLCTPQDLATFQGRDSWKDETAWNYEVGTRSRLMGGRAQMNVSAFHMDIRDLQLVVTAGSCSSRLVFNVPKSVSQGLEFELTAAPTDYFDFAVSVTGTRSELGSTLTSSQGIIAGIEKGNRLPSVPKMQSAAAATYRWPLRLGSQVALTGTFQHVGSRITQVDDHTLGRPHNLDLTSFGDNTIGGPLTQGTFTFNPELPAYSLMNLRASWMRDRWEYALFGTNLTDERALLALDRERGLRARVGYLTNQPRTIGVSARFDF